MTILENIQQLLRHLTTEQELKEVKKNGCFIRNGVK